MSLSFARLGLALGLMLGSLPAQEARVRSAAEVAMPTQVDSNSPAFWRDGRLFWFGSHGRPLLSEGPDQFGPWTTREVSLETPNAWPHWMEAVAPDDDGVLWGWYHTEPIGLVPNSTLTAPKIGAVVSLDGGRSLRDLGHVLESGDPIDPTAQNGYFAGGHGDFTVLADREKRWFYFFFDNYGGPTETQGVAIARMAYEDRFNPVGKVWKFHNGAWQEPGKGGKVTPIFPVQKSWQRRDPEALWGPSVHWNTHLRSYVMLLNRASGEPGWSQEGVYVSFNADLSRPDGWTEPVKILDKSQFSGWYFFYPQVMGLESGGTDRLAGRVARLYVNGISKWEIEFVRRPSAPVEVQVAALPSTGTVVSGGAASFTVTALGNTPMSYQWFKDGIEIPGATSATLLIAAAGSAQAGLYTVVVTNELGAATSAPVMLTVQVPIPVVTPVVPPVVTEPPVLPAPYLANLSVRAVMADEHAVLTVGYVLHGAAAKPLLIRAVGPGLAQFGVLGAVENPRLELFDAAAEKVAANDDWLPALAADFAAVGAFPLPVGSADAAMLGTAPAGSGTAQVRATGGGLALVEIYDPAPARSSRIVNVSARAQVAAGDGVLIGGFGLSGTGSRRLLIRALGPQLENYGVASALADPVLEIYGAGDTKIAESDNWSEALAAIFAEAGAPALAPGSRDAALVLTLPAGATYTAVVHSRDPEAAGEALLEIYELAGGSAPAADEAAR